MTGELAEKLGIKKWQIVALAKLFKMKGNPEFHKAGKISKSSFVQRYSEKARRVMAAAIEKDGIANLLAAAKAGEHRNPSAYPVKGINVDTQSTATAPTIQ